MHKKCCLFGIWIFWSYCFGMTIMIMKSQSMCNRHSTILSYQKRNQDLYANKISLVIVQCLLLGAHSSQWTFWGSFNETKMELNGNDQCSNGNEVNIKQMTTNRRDTNKKNRNYFKWCCHQIHGLFSRKSRYLLLNALVFSP